MTVTNVNGTSGLKCKCGSWLDHWKKYGGGAIPTYCCEKSCLNKDLVGAHVQKGILDNNWYIIPLCNKHNQKATSLEVYDTTNFVSANQSQTCG